jgi:3-deoxy-manno-octulosonate cytidylyltransferase (CMP-KDO synthetase)
MAGILPARWGSTRFPGKPLHRLAGKTLIQHVWERCKECHSLNSITIATDDQRIFDEAKSFGADAVMTSDHHITGTDRIAEAAKNISAATHIINIQGDEPLIDPALIDQLVAALKNDPSLPMITAANPLNDDASFFDPNVVKVTLDINNHALYFSRAPIPYQRTKIENLKLFRHKGIYGYKLSFLKEFVSWPPSPLEQAESLEQLRALENGARIKVIITDDNSIGLDTPEQAHMIEEILLKK